MDVDLNTIPLIIKTGAANTISVAKNGFKQIERFSSAYDLLPTVLDLLGIKFNERLYVGNSLFGQIDDAFVNESGKYEEVIIYYSLTGGLISDRMYTFNMNEYVYDEFVTMQYYNKFKEVAYHTLEKLNYIYTLYVYNAYENILPV